MLAILAFGNKDVFPWKLIRNNCINFVPFI